VAAIGEEGGGILRAAGDQVLAQPLAVRGRDGRARGEIGVWLGVARKHAEHDAAFACHGLDLVDTVAPVGRTAQHAQHDQPCMGEGLLDVEIDRERMLQLQQVGKAEREGCRVMGAGQRGELAVGGGKDDDVGGGLCEIDGFGSAVNHARCRGEEVHQPRSMAAIASRSMCFSPITTSSVPRLSPAFHGRSK